VSKSISSDELADVPAGHVSLDQCSTPPQKKKFWQALIQIIPSFIPSWATAANAAASIQNSIEAELH